MGVFSWFRLAALAILAMPVVGAACGDGDDDEPTPEVDAGLDGGGEGRADSGADASAAEDSGTDAAPDSGVDAGPQIAELLGAVEGLTVVDRGGGFFELLLEQPIDHADPGGATFEQRLTLVHRSIEAPMVLVSTGYDDYLQGRVQNLTARLAANQITVEKRYHGASVPEVVDWTTLNVEQIAGDLHRIVEALGTVYVGPWIGTGKSMGGTDSVLHRRFFPADMVGTVAYGSAFLVGTPDTRFPAFFEDVVDASCEQALEAVQIAMLGDRREAMIVLAEELADAQGYTFERLGEVEAALETSVLSLPWVFWQYRSAADCAIVPDAEADDDATLYDFFEVVQGIRSANDEWWDYFGPYYYQVQSWLGWPEIPAGHLGGLLSPDVVTIEEGLVPEDADPPVFDATVVPDLLAWLNDEASDVVLIYGELDPWSASRADLAGADGVLEVVASGENHGVEIDDLEPADRDAVTGLLEEWTAQ